MSLLTLVASYCNTQSFGSHCGIGNRVLLARKISALLVITLGSLSAGRSVVDSAHGGCCVGLLALAELVSHGSVGKCGGPPESPSTAEACLR